MITLFELGIESIKKEGGCLSPSRILYEILKDECIRDYTYVILGKSGPTGKTWLWDKLRNEGFGVIEISEDIYKLVDYTDDHNHCIVDNFRKTIIIILNKRL
jgi:hypothetical protein